MQIHSVGCRFPGKYLRLFLRLLSAVSFVTANEFPASILERIFARDDRPAFEVAANVLRELLDRRIATLRVFSHRHQNNVVEIAFEAPAQSRRFAVPRRAHRLGRDGRSRPMAINEFLYASDNRARSFRILLTNDPLDLAFLELLQPRAVPNYFCARAHGLRFSVEILKLASLGWA